MAGIDLEMIFNSISYKIANNLKGVDVYLSPYSPVLFEMLCVVIDPVGCLTNYPE